MTTDLHKQIKLLIIDSLGLEDISIGDIDDNMPLFGDDGLGLDSVDALELGLAIQKTFGLTLDNDNEALRQKFYSVATLAELIQMHQTAK